MRGRERGRKRGREREGEGREREKVGGRAGGGKKLYYTRFSLTCWIYTHNVI